MPPKGRRDKKINKHVQCPYNVRKCFVHHALNYSNANFFFFQPNL